VLWHGHNRGCVVMQPFVFHVSKWYGVCLLG